MLRKIRRFLPLDQRKLYYNAGNAVKLLYNPRVNVHSHMHQPYGHLDLLRICRKTLNSRNARHVSVILGADTKANSVQLFRKLDWVPFFHEAKVKRLLMVYKRLSEDCPSYMSQMLMRNADINDQADMDY